VVAEGAVLSPPKPPEQLGRDIVFIKDAPGQLRVRGPAFYSRTWFLALQLLPVLTFVGLLAVVRRRERFAADPRLTRFHQAGREVRRRLSSLSETPAEGGRFYDELTAAVHSYLSAKLDLPPGAVERNRVLERLARNGSPTDLHEHVSSFFDLVEGARYAASRTAAPQREEALRLAREIVEGLERQRGRSSRFAAGWLFVLFACAVPLTDVGAEAQGEPPGGGLTAFFQGNTAYQGAAYDRAARSYQQLVDDGLESGSLYFNLGNAYFKDGQLGRAILNYERAKRLLPRDPDVQVNLSYALELAREEVPKRPFWQRLLFPFASRATTGQLSILVSLLWFALAAVLIVGGSLAFRVATVELRRDAVVVEAGETAVRFEPSENGTEHFRVAEGALLEVTDERDEWLQVRRWDGRRGWIPGEVLELIQPS